MSQQLMLDPEATANCRLQSTEDRLQETYSSLQLGEAKL